MSYREILDEAWKLHLAPRSPDAPTVVSLFAGCGGSSLGYSMAGFRELLAVEWDDNAVATFKLNFPGVPVFHGDIAKLSAEECLNLAGLEPGQLDVLDGSPPCQGFSTAGKRIIDDPRNSLFREYARLLRTLQPKVFVMENVSGMVKGKMRLVFVEILKELKTCGYRVSAKLMNAMYFNVPQSRQRTIFIGALNRDPSHPLAASHPFGIAFPETRTEAQRISLHKITVALAHKARHKAKGNGFGFQVLSNKQPCPTWPKTMMVSTSGPRFVVNEQHWLPSPVELSAFGSYPVDFQFAGGYAKQWARIGNSVPPLFMRAIAQHIKTNLLEKSI